MHNYDYINVDDKTLIVFVVNNIQQLSWKSHIEMDDKFYPK